ncbi:hypothetical protein HAX54_049343 [Datura stramonium]|uniref:Uncharacterized protein n=1 Tax=Datura stramonium TaxID=4076 RepID=A0ABS8SVA8_DATST|nr:hypothetical protein [Datura stramonium]
MGDLAARRLVDADGFLDYEMKRRGRKEKRVSLVVEIWVLVVCDRSKTGWFHGGLEENGVLEGRSRAVRERMRSGGGGYGVFRSKSSTRGGETRPAFRLGVVSREDKGDKKWERVRWSKFAGGGERRDGREWKRGELRENGVGGGAGLKNERRKMGEWSKVLG